MPSSAVRALLVDDHDVFRHGLARLLREHGIDVVAEASGGEAGVRLAAELAPDVVVMDLHMPGTSGLEAMRAIAAAGPRPHVLALSMAEDPDEMLAALLAGAAGYVVKDAPVEQLADAIRATATGEATIPAAVAPELLRRLRGAQPPPGLDGDPQLSARELDVLRLIVDGRDNAAIAAQLFISPNTVKSHVASIFGKLGVESRLQASVHALRRGLVR